LITPRLYMSFSSGLLPVTRRGYTDLATFLLFDAKERLAEPMAKKKSTKPAAQKKSVKKTSSPLILASEVQELTPVSPFSTGHGGAGFELKVAVTYIAAMLTDRTARGCEEGPIRAVKLQQRNRGKEVDDIIVVYERGSTEGETHLQVKHKIRFAEGNAEFQEALAQCWKQFRKDDFDHNRHRVGICFAEASNIQKVRDHLPDVLQWAIKSENAAAYLKKVNGFKAKKTICDAFRNTLNKAANRQISDEDLWHFLRVLVCIPCDLDGTHSRDVQATIEILRDLVPERSVSQAQTLMGVLFKEAAEFANKGGEISVGNLASLLPGPTQSRIPAAARNNARSIQDCLADQVRRQLTRQINSRKYIPDLFQESRETKDIARMFCHPVLFFEMCLNELQLLNLSRINSFNREFALEEIVIPLRPDFVPPHDLRDVSSACDELLAVCEKLTTELDGRSRPPKGTNLSEHQQYVMREKWHTLSTWSLKYRIEAIEQHLQYLKGGVLLFLSPAGQGKTNLVCDLAKMALQRGIPAIFLTGKGLANASLDNLTLAVFRSVDPSISDTNSFLEQVVSLVGRTQIPLLIIIDAINEHHRLTEFATALESCLDYLLSLGYVRVVLTCRSEFYDARFQNLEHAAFRDVLTKVPNLHQRMESVQKRRMVARHLHFYNIRVSMTSKARQALESDPLLLRIFCEAYGDTKSVSVLHLPPLADIYRDRLFNEYLIRRLKELADARAERGEAPRLAGENHYLIPLLSIIEHMVLARDFSSVEVTSLMQSQLPAIEELLYEEIIIRKDIARDQEDGGVEVIGFPFDELRDFLIARYLVEKVLMKSEDEFLTLTRDILRPQYPIAEGAARYLFYTAKLSKHRNLNRLVQDEEWYKASFLDSIFAIEDQLIAESDIEEIRRRYTEEPTSVPRIATELILRFDENTFPNLNIRLLFDLLDGMSHEQYHTFFVPIFRSSHYSRPSWPIEEFSANLENVIVNGSTFGEDADARLFKMLLYVLTVKDQTYCCPARDAAIRIVQVKPDLTGRVLLSSVERVSPVFSASLWDLLGDLVRAGVTLPEDIFDAAVKAWARLPSREDNSTEKVQLLQYFHAIKDREGGALPANVDAALVEFYKQRSREWQIP